MSYGMQLQWDDGLVKQFMDNLASLQDIVPEKIAKPAVKKAAQVVVKAAQQNILVSQSGFLKQFVDVKVILNKLSGSVTAIIGEKRGLAGTFTYEFSTTRADGSIRNYSFTRNVRPTLYSHLLELGTHQQPDGYLQPKLDFFHPMNQPHPYLQPAMEDHVGEVTQVLADEVQRNLEKEFGKA